MMQADIDKCMEMRLQLAAYKAVGEKIKGEIYSERCLHDTWAARVVLSDDNRY